MKRKILELEQGIVKIEDYKEEEDKGNLNKVLGNSLGLGFSVSLPIVAGVIFGLYLDKRFGFYPLATLFCAFLGAFLGLFSIIRQIKQ